MDNRTLTIPSRSQEEAWNFIEEFGLNDFAHFAPPNSAITPAPISHTSSMKIIPIVIALKNKEYNIRIVMSSVLL